MAHLELTSETLTSAFSRGLTSSEIPDEIKQYPWICLSGALRGTVTISLDPLFKCVPQLLDRSFAGHDCITQLLLLAPDLGLERGVIGLQLPQSPYVRSIGGANEVRQHVDFGKNLAQQRVGCSWVRQRCPIGAGDFALLHRVLPKSAYFLRRFRFGELIDCHPVPAIECLMEQLGAPLTLAGKQNSTRVQIVLRGGRRLPVSELCQDLLQLGCRQAGADDRTVQMGRKVPDPRPTLRCSRRLVLSRDRAVAQQRRRRAILA